MSEVFVVIMSCCEKSVVKLATTDCGEAKYKVLSYENLDPSSKSMEFPYGFYDFAYIQRWKFDILVETKIYQADPNNNCKFKYVKTKFS